MENEKNLLELLVKIASYGTAGAGVLGIFSAWKIVSGLPNDVTKEKSSAAKMFMTLCIIAVISCTISGGLNSYFNMKKIQDAKNEVTEITNQYDIQVNKLLKSKAEISKQLNILQQNYPNQATTSGEFKKAVDNIGKNVNAIDMLPTHLLVKSISKKKEP
jgi:hypothetical protein